MMGSAIFSATQDGLILSKFLAMSAFLLSIQESHSRDLSSVPPA